MKTSMKGFTNRDIFFRTIKNQNKKSLIFFLTFRLLELVRDFFIEIDLFKAREIKGDVCSGQANVIGG